MSESPKRIIKATRIYWAIHTLVAKWGGQWKFMWWMIQEKPGPPPHAAKEIILRGCAREYELRILVETGTFLDDMVEALRQDFDRVYSIELGTNLYEGALQRFKGRRNVELIHGDSGTEIDKFMNRIEQPALFWLDAHNGWDDITGRMGNNGHKKANFIYKISINK